MRVALLVLLSLAAFWARAEGGCPPGQYPIGGQGDQGCAPIPGAGGWQQSPGNASYLSQMEDAAATAIAAAARAADRKRIREDATRDWWGVVVVSTQDGAWNAALNAKTGNDAAVDALSRCKGTCTPVLSFANSCVAPAYSSEGGMYWSPGDSREKANATAVAACSAQGGTGCESPPEEAFCSGWKYAYSGRERFSHRLVMDATGSVASPKLVEFPGAKDYIARPLGQRGAAIAMSRASQKGDGPGDETEAKPQLAKPWFAIAASKSTDAFAAKVAPSEQVAKETAVSACGEDCSVLVAATQGECLAVIRAPQPGGRVASFGGRGYSTAEAEQAALSACKASKAEPCPIVLSQCLK
jgi:hypothetical protein